MKGEKITLCWFRRDLRLDDNTALHHALQSGKKVVPLFIFDKNILDELPDKKDRRVDFIYQALQHLNTELKKFNSSFFVLHDTPEKAFEFLLQKFDIEHVFTNRDYEPYAIRRDEKIKQLLSKKNIPFHDFKDQVVFEKSEVVKPDGLPYTIFTPYSKVWKNSYHQSAPEIHHSEELFSQFYPETFNLPTLKEIGFEKTDYTFHTPELDKKIIVQYEEFRNIPALDRTTHLSVHLRFGTISIRKAVAFGIKTNEKWLNELIWREFFMQIIFHFPQVVTTSFKKKYDTIKWRNDEKEYHQWREGRTGYAIVDAGMRELNETGFMHNRVRMIVASFLTKHLLIDWRWGEAYFAEKLLDYDLSANNGNWQWAAGCGCDAAPYFRVFNPDEQTKKFDPDLIYIRRWITEFNDLSYPQKMIDHKTARERALKTFKAALEK